MDVIRLIVLRYQEDINSSWP